ncbi:sugar nucleotide-binding protein [Mycolicibacterium litorale]|uniref:dTDP-4-dehydrorhamnose reductase n=1 Tax=Mycolicibacterium litorale TaxID=758802 RepID=A0AAD1IQ94_9MYCO|nr:bifunctional dTDP-4-dehydrorhamnose 3,5-epimerase family protein/NAD(P)-dependent oxidoreductase [Mycolicibacterium litorale]MCV7416417.1 sugar nucleotide-binding protein [Mycolicibacterium litorale]TDY09671.1 dTDP-4-dehydrorhamnose reductase /dTDP-4-dehydrorhamnose 3,5-epimerase [Mycolicibacterium litorale]BBY17617.1 dTDP-4-dehydrorhamnose reductase [Mycolicibacterium litorale]
MTEFAKELRATPTAIPGLTLWDLPVHGDNRGWFKENWQREKMLAAGMPDFGPVQNNVSFNNEVGTTRGIHAEPWDKFVSVATGRVFAAWVDLRQGPTFGTLVTSELDPSRAVYVPRGVGNSFQTLEPNTAYTYLVNDHYSPNATYSAVNLADETLAVDWPIPLQKAALSSKDRNNPRLSHIEPIRARKVLILGASGQLGLALRKVYSDCPDVEFANRTDIELASDRINSIRPWRDYRVVINAAAYTAVDAAETPAGRKEAWATNVTAVAALARLARAFGLTLVHISSDYVFDGNLPRPYREDDALCPLGVYGQTKAAGDEIASTAHNHYILRTSWVVGEGQNFVRTMLSLAERGIDPSVVNDQHGRLTFASDLATAIRDLIDKCAPYGTYNFTGGGTPMSWEGIAREVFALAGHSPERVTGVSTEDYFKSASGPVAARPRNSALDLNKIEPFTDVPDHMDRLEQYIRAIKPQAG